MLVLKFLNMVKFLSNNLGFTCMNLLLFLDCVSLYNRFAWICVLKLDGIKLKLKSLMRFNFFDFIFLNGLIYLVPFEKE